MRQLVHSIAIAALFGGAACMEDVESTSTEASGSAFEQIGDHEVADSNTWLWEVATGEDYVDGAATLLRASEAGGEHQIQFVIGERLVATATFTETRREAEHLTNPSFEVHAVRGTIETFEGRVIGVAARILTPTDAAIEQGLRDSSGAARSIFAFERVDHGHVGDEHTNQIASAELGVRQRGEPTLYSCTGDCDYEYNVKVNLCNQTEIACLAGVAAADFACTAGCTLLASPAAALTCGAACASVAAAATLSCRASNQTCVTNLWFERQHCRAACPLPPPTGGGGDEGGSGTGGGGSVPIPPGMTCTTHASGAIICVPTEQE